MVRGGFHCAGGDVDDGVGGVGGVDDLLQQSGSHLRQPWWTTEQCRMSFWKCEEHQVSELKF